MALNDLKRRLGRLEKRPGVSSNTVPDESHVALARELNLARMVLDAEREARRLLLELAQTKGAGLSVSSVDTLAAFELEVAELERRCRDAGLTEEFIGRFNP